MRGVRIPQWGGETVRREDKQEATRVLQGRAPGAQRPEYRTVLTQIFEALKEKGYDPVRQIAHFLLTGEPTYITAHRGARALAHRLERDEVVEELLRHYLGL